MDFGQFGPFGPSVGGQMDPRGLSFEGGQGVIVPVDCTERSVSTRAS